MGFRFFAEEVAVREGLQGHVRNLPDGSVEALVEGDAESVERFERAVRRGPPASRIDEVHVEIVPSSGRLGGFLICP